MAERTSYLGWKMDFTQPAGEPSYYEPDSVVWRVSKNPITFAIGGICAVLLEFADPRIRSGVWDHSTYKVDPVGRSQRTGYAASIGTYGPVSGARRVISGVNKMHARVEGDTPDGTHYRALDTALLDWVSATASYGFISAYSRFAAPMTQEEIDTFYKESQALVALYGVKECPASEQDFYAMMMKLEPGFEPHQIVFDFLDIVQNSNKGRSIPGFVRKYIACAAVDILPPAVRERLQLGKEFDLSPLGRLVVKGFAKLADIIPNKQGPAAQACERLGLPRNFLWLNAKKQQALLAERRASADWKASAEYLAEQVPG
jgi:uncharacterized protein (DUF2236 family)